MNFMQIVTFSLNNGEYGIDISCVQEIMRISNQITKIPNVPAYVEGMFNLRGKVVYVVDLKKRFYLEETGRNADSRLLILKLEELMIGIIVDDVSDVLRIDRDSIESFCSELESISGSVIRGICKMDDRLILVLDESRLKVDVFQKNDEMEEAV